LRKNSGFSLIGPNGTGLGDRFFRRSILIG
jgi:hypothetical protein